MRANRWVFTSSSCLRPGEASRDFGPVLGWSDAAGAEHVGDSTNDGHETRVLDFESGNRVVQVIEEAFVLLVVLLVGGAVDSGHEAVETIAVILRERGRPGDRRSEFIDQFIKIVGHPVIVAHKTAGSAEARSEGCG